MNEIAKVFSSLLLLGAGFAGASLFGPPDLVDNFAAQWNRPAQKDPQALRPLDANTPSMPQPLLADAALATPIETAQNQTGLQPAIGQFAADSQSNQTMTTQWNDQPSQMVNSQSDWLREIHEGGFSGAAPQKPMTQQPHQVAKANSALASLPELQAPNTSHYSHQTKSPAANPTSADAWGIPDFESNDQPFSNQPMNGEFQAPAIQDSFGSVVDQSRNSLPFESTFADIEAPSVRRAPQMNAADSDRTHVVADGDTLPTIAERYLGDARMAQELYRYNQDRLEHPDLLPIGVILKLPSRPAQITPAPRLAPSHTRSADSPFTTIGQATESMSQQPSGFVHESKLVPIGEAMERPAAETPQLLYQDEYSW